MWYIKSKMEMEKADMLRYIVSLTDDEIKELKAQLQKGGKG